MHNHAEQPPCHRQDFPATPLLLSWNQSFALRRPKSVLMQGGCGMLHLGAIGRARREVSLTAICITGTRGGAIRLVASHVIYPDRSLEQTLGLVPVPIIAVDESGTIVEDRTVVGADVERAHILAVLESCGWRVKGRGNAAEQLGLKESTLRSRMKRLGITRP